MDKIPENVREVVSNHPNYTASSEDVDVSDVEEYILRELDSYDKDLSSLKLDFEIVKREQKGNLKNIFHILIEDSFEVIVKRIGENSPYGWYIVRF